jgi:hypothetical protein
MATHAALICAPESGQETPTPAKHDTCHGNKYPNVMEHLKKQRNGWIFNNIPPRVERY